jgi:hypothetical protein
MQKYMIYYKLEFYFKIVSQKNTINMLNNTMILYTRKNYKTKEWTVFYEFVSNVKYIIQNK